MERRNRLANSIIFYDINVDNVDIKGWYEYVLEFFKKYNQMPGRAAADGLNIPSSSKNRTFRYCDKKLRSNDFQGIEHIWFASHIEDFYDDYNDAVFIVDAVLLERMKYIMVSFDNDIIDLSNRELINRLAKDLSKFIKGGYGFVFQRHFNRGPNLYAAGAIHNEAYSQQESTQIGNWARAYGKPERYQHGDLRDIYPMNFLSRAHLDRVVSAGQTLEDWIKSTTEHGTLSPLNETLWTWEVPSEHIESIREALAPTGIIVCLRDR